MTNDIEKEVEALLRQGMSKERIWRKMKKETNPHKALFYINNSSLPRDRKRYQVINLVLALALTFLTAKKLITAFSFGTLDIYLLLGLVVPIINIYILREILRFHRIGYKFLFILSILSLLQPENHHSQELFLLGLLIGLSGFMYRKLFPEKETLTL